MNAVLILVGLLVLSYLGSFLVTGRSVRGGLPSGVEYAALAVQTAVRFDAERAFAVERERQTGLTEEH